MTLQIDVEIPEIMRTTYPIMIGSGLLKKIEAFLPESTGIIMIISDETVQHYYGTILKQSLIDSGYEVLSFAFPAGEASKNILLKTQIESEMINQGCDRYSVILALGGGVVGDIAGFIAATYMRGIAYLQIPTTLLAMIDSSVGGKTGIDTPEGKNLIGAFWQPTAVISDVLCLKSLPQQHLISGLIEALKIFLTSDPASLFFLQKHLDDILNYDEAILVDIISRAVRIKAEIVRRDEKELHERAILNFGHTIGHALEQLSNYQLLHGYAVALGILVEAKIAELQGILGAKHYAFIEALLYRLNIRPQELVIYDVNHILAATKVDKKKRFGQVHYVLLKDLGHVYHVEKQYVHPVPDMIIKQALSLYCEVDDERK